MSVEGFFYMFCYWADPSFYKQCWIAITTLFFGFFFSFFPPECSPHKGYLVIWVLGSDVCQLQKMYTEANTGQILLVDSTVGHLVS